MGNVPCNDMNMCSGDRIALSIDNVADKVMGKSVTTEKELILAKTTPRSKHPRGQHKTLRNKVPENLLTNEPGHRATTPNMSTSTPEGQLSSRSAAEQQPAPSPGQTVRRDTHTVPNTSPAVAAKESIRSSASDRQPMLAAADKAKSQPATTSNPSNVAIPSLRLEVGQQRSAVGQQPTPRSAPGQQPSPSAPVLDASSSSYLISWPASRAMPSPRSDHVAPILHPQQGAISPPGYYVAPPASGPVAPAAHYSPRTSPSHYVPRPPAPGPVPAAVLYSPRTSSVSYPMPPQPPAAGYPYGPPQPQWTQARWHG